MDTEPIEIFVHAGGQSHVVHANPEETVRQLLLRLQVGDDAIAAHFLFVGECDEALAEADDVEDGVDTHPPIEIDMCIETLDLGRHRHIHHHPCRAIAVEVNFTGKSKKHRFSPAATVETVAQWARKKFHLDPAVASEYVLQFCGTAVQPRSDQHLSQLPEAAHCALCFDLVPEVTPQG